MACVRKHTAFCKLKLSWKRQIFNRSGPAFFVAAVNFCLILDREKHNPITGAQFSTLPYLLPSGLAPPPLRALSVPPLCALLPHFPTKQSSVWLSNTIIYLGNNMKGSCSKHGGQAKQAMDAAAPASFMQRWSKLQHLSPRN